MKTLLLICSLLAVPVYANPVANLSEVGRSEMNWMFWKLYDIKLLSHSGRYQEKNYPIALVIEYARDIEASMLIKSTLKEWQRLAVEWKPDWQKQLENIWPSVKSGDELLLLVKNPGVSQFFYNRELIGEITDSEFAPAFLSIWLSTNTRKPEIRKQLLGEFDA